MFIDDRSVEVVGLMTKSVGVVMIPMMAGERFTSMRYHSQ